jgi:outer membrane protein, adhesin transport system
MKFKAWFLCACLRACLCAGLCACLWPASAHAQRCIDDDDSAAEAVSTPAAGPTRAPLQALVQTLVREALRQSDAVGAANLLAQAAQSDIEAARAAALPQATLSGSTGPGGSRFENTTQATGWQARTSLNVSALIYDSGRNRELTDSRSHLADAARLAGLSAREQVALQTVSLALEHSRNRLQLQIHQQYRRKMGCLVQALQEIVNADRGRNSELVQARKNEQQAELLVLQSESVLKQGEIRLQRFVGTSSPVLQDAGDAASALLLAPPPLPAALDEAASASDIAQLAAQAEAQHSLARSVKADGGPQLSWVLSGAKAVGAGRSTTWNAGVALNLPLLDPGTQPSLDAARARAAAARLQFDDALRQRRARVAEVHEQATSAFERARRSALVVRDSDQLRNFTLQQWQQLGRRSLFDVMAAESEHYALRVAQVNALHEGQQATALLYSLGRGISAWLQ